MRPTIFIRSMAWAICLCVLGLMVPGVSYAKTAQEIDASVNAALARFEKQVKGSDKMIAESKGVLVFAGVFQAGFGIGGEYGEGAMRIKGKTAGYHSITQGSFGFQLGAQKKDIILVFMSADALQKFQTAEQGGPFTLGVDAGVALINVGAEGSVNSSMYNKPIVGFVVGQAGLMYNLSLSGSKISKLNK